MAQTTDVLIPRQHYTRADFTALRAWLNRLPIARIAALYYGEDDLEAIGCLTPDALQYRLETMRDTLVQRASDTNPFAAEGLKSARKLHRWSKLAIQFLEQEAESGIASPKPSDPISVWLKPRVSEPLKSDGLRTLADLLQSLATRGSSWWKPIPRIGARKAEIIVRWLESHQTSLGDVIVRPLIPVSADHLVVLEPSNPVLVPLERVRLPLNFDGTQGINRNTSFSLISARTDLEAIDSYLYKFRAQEKTERAYRKELERFLLWCIYARKKPMSSVLMEDCEAYKDFLARPDREWIGPRAPRLASSWRPFASIPSPKSQRYATQAIRTFFEWLVNVRYLAGNPWVTVSDPAVAKEITPLQIDKALPKDLWAKLMAPMGLLDQLIQTQDAVLRGRYKLRGATAQLSMSAQFRLVKAALLLMGDAGLRREEVAFATRDKLKPVPGVPHLWELDVLGKRNKWRTVFLPDRAINALKAHWEDRQQDFSFGMAEIPLISPLFIPKTQEAGRKHLGESGVMKESGFSQDGLYHAIKTALLRVANDETLALEPHEGEILRRAGPHAFRHTFGTQAAASDVPLDVLQRVLGHASLQTTTIYVQAEKQRSIEELGRFFSS